MKAENQGWDNESGHLNSAKGRITHDPNATLPYTAALDHPRNGAVRQSFATMREAEAYIKANTPRSSAALSALYDRPGSD